MVTNDTYEIVVAPNSGSTGQNLIELMNCLNIPVRLPFVVVADVECNGDRRWVQRPPFPSTTQEVVRYAESVGQFDWATFFFFRQDLPNPAQPYDALFADAELIMRAVDDTYFYVYSPVPDDATRLGEFFPVTFERKRADAVVHPF